MEKKKIFFVAYGAGHIGMLIPVIHQLRKDASLDIVVLGLTTARDKLEAAGIPYLGYSDLIKAMDNYAQVKAYGERLVAALPAGTVPVEESVAYLGANYAELVQAFGEAAAAARYHSEGRQAYLPVNFMKRVLEKYQPDLVVATNSPRTERAAIVAAGALAIPALCLVDLFALQEVAWIGEPGYADRICVLSQAVKDMFVAHGRQDSEVVVTGNPAFDPLSAPGLVGARESVRQAHGWSEDDKVILFASQVEPLKHPFNDLKGNSELPRDIERALCRIVEKHSNYRLIVRHHPSETVEPAAMPARVEIGDKSENLAALLHSVDVVVVMSSTVGLEAALIGKPVVSVDMSVFTPDAPYAEMGISLGVGKLDALEAAVDKAIAGGAPNGAVCGDGKATARIVAEIKATIA
ncbi:hypothetical protein [Janthinobacterium sp. 17J80-10]|uniref:hypothetical protein n=1 Tax=Janthinobacterium sp. 17J80-10 TaxID=2497863 RepID=UPI001005A1E0|nr:hypothetical protein [Janthinobacterium sp. 17J80-10]QAU33072.1 hypothetical protein EKL02_02165 [Janthinobacterium sp. 17J80-10]